MLKPVIVVNNEEFPVLSLSFFNGETYQVSYKEKNGDIKNITANLAEENGEIEKNLHFSAIVKNHLNVLGAEIEEEKNNCNSLSNKIAMECSQTGVCPTETVEEWKEATAFYAGMIRAYEIFENGI